MDGLDPHLLADLSQTLAQCSPLQSTNSLRAVFTDSRINLWKDDLPERESVKARVEALISYLQPKSNRQHQPALFLLLLVLAGRLPAEDAQRQQLHDLALRLSDHWRPRPPLPATRCPYQGMALYDVADAPLFYGREWLTACLVHRLAESANDPQASRFLAIVGASGSGKSSLARAGLLAALQNGAPLADGSLPPAGSPHWLYYTVKPGSAPLETLIGALTAGQPFADAQTLRDPQKGLAADAHCLAHYAHHLLAPQDTPYLLLLVDQFEELFTLCPDRQERQAFVSNLLAAARPGSRVWVVITLRADFYAHCAEFPDLFGLLPRQQQNVAAMSDAELRRAIEQPARQVGWTLAEGVVETILADMQAVGSREGALPLLSHALQQSWHRCHAAGANEITLHSYQQAGGVGGAIAQTAEETYQALAEEEKEIARNLFLRLIRLGEGAADTRRRVPLAELQFAHVPAAQMDAVRHKLADKRLIVTDEREVDLIHEALIREWARLRAWLDRDRAGEQVHRRLREAAAGWIAHDQDSGYLYRGGALSAAAEWAQAHVARLNQAEQLFLQSSLAAAAAEEQQKEAARQRELQAAQDLAAEAEARRQAETERAEAQTRFARRVQQGAVALGIFLVVAVAAALLAFSAQRTAQTEAHIRATAEANALAEADSRATAQVEAEQQAHARATAEAVALTRQAEEANARATAEVAQALAEERVQEAEQQRTEAERQAQIAQSQGLAATSETVRQGNSMLAWLLAIEAGRSYPTTLAYTALDQQVSWLAKPGITIAHDAQVNGARWNGDESQLLSWSWDGTAKVWDADTGRLRLTLNHDDEVNGASWNGDGSQLLSWSWDGTAKVWDATTGRLRLTLNHEDGVHGASWNGDESQLLSWSWDGTVKVWDAGTGSLRLTLNHEGLVTGASWNGDESQLLSWSADGTAKVWDASTGSLRLTLNHEGPVWGASWNGDESQLLSWSSDGTAKVWDAGTGRLRLTLNHEGPVWGATWNGDESQLLSWSADGTAKVWDAATGRLRLTLNHEDGVHGASWNGDDSQLLSWSGETFSSTGEVKVWDAGTGRLRLTLNHVGRVWGATWNGDESQLLSWSADGTAKVWDAGTGSLRLTLNHEDRVTGARWNGDESQLLSWSWDGTAKVWDARAGSLRLTLNHEDRVTGARWNGDESQLLSWSWDGTAKVWDTQTGGLLLILPGNGTEVTSVQWNGDESGILLTTAGGLVKLYYTPDQFPEMLAAACEYATRNMNWTEWQVYLPGQPYRQTCPQLPVHPSVPAE